MEKFKILDVSRYRDGGTLVIKTNKGNFHIDNRLLSDGKSPTKGMLFLGYPSNENLPLPFVEAKRWKKVILNALKSFISLTDVSSYVLEIKNIKTK